MMGEGKLAEFPARTILEVLFTKEPAALLTVATRAARYDVIAGRGGIRFASRGTLGGETAMFLLLMEHEGSFTLGPVAHDYASNCTFVTLADLDHRFAAWQERLKGVDQALLDPGNLYWWRSRLSKDVQQLSGPEYEVAQLTRDRALSIDVIASTLGKEIIDIARVLAHMARLEPFEAVPYTRRPRLRTFHGVVASRDPLNAATLWKSVCTAEIPLQWDTRSLLYRQTLSHPAYDVELVFLTQATDDTMRDIVRAADIMLFLLSDFPCDEERYLNSLRALNAEVKVFFWGTKRRRWLRHVPESVYLSGALAKDAILQGLDVFL
jgi:hypothetical protein